MKLKFKCKNCDRVYMVDLSGSEYFLPKKCPSCGYQYQNDDALQRWLAQVKEELEREKGMR